MENSMNETQIEKIEGESNKVYQERLEFIKKVNSDISDMKEAIRLSKIWVNFKYNNCRYTPEVFSKIKPYLK
tara:strand:- start:40 stop:255 length:216 start_codon:yes stop_codon:yes gene_type:complete